MGADDDAPVPGVAPADGPRGVPHVWLDLPAAGPTPALSSAVLSYRHRVTAEVTLARAAAGDPRRIGRSRHGVLSVSRRLDHASPGLAHAASAGTRLDGAVLRVHRPAPLGGAGPTVPWFRVTLDGVYVVSVLTTLDADGPLETVELDYAAITWAYEGPRPADGGVAPPTTWTVYGADEG